MIGSRQLSSSFSSWSNFLSCPELQLTTLFNIISKLERTRELSRSMCWRFGMRSRGKRHKTRCNEVSGLGNNMLAGHSWSWSRSKSIFIFQRVKVQLLQFMLIKMSHDPARISSLRRCKFQSSPSAVERMWTRTRTLVSLRHLSFLTHRVKFN